MKIGTSLLFVAAAAVLGMTAAASPASAQQIGVVLMHGKTGSPYQLESLAAALRGAGYIVETPEMCWSYRRIYDRSLLDCLTEADAAAAGERARGAGRIVIAGMSQGGDAALVYGARRTDLAGIIALAPAASPEHQVTVPQIAHSVAQAQAMVAAGRGNETGEFYDQNVLRLFPVRTTAAIYLSYMDPHGPANMAAAIRQLQAPLLWIAGTADRSQAGAQHEFYTAPANPQNRFVSVSSDHLGTPNAARPAVLAWLPTLK
jgi:esterase/lipase